ncbi:MAG: cbb3-type cytochrome c oxidase subunit 3 [Anaerolineales bacterium]|jgi:cbb3-type cytochrome oxidase subunit 3
MYKEILQSIKNVEIWGIISLILFFLFFIGVVIKVILIDKKYIRKMEKMPLDDETMLDDGTTNNQSTE